MTESTDTTDRPSLDEPAAPGFADLGLDPRVLQAITDAGYERNVDTHIKALRAKLREISPGVEPILTHRGFGYSYQPAGRDGDR